MSNSALELPGKRSDYTLQMVTTEGGDMPVLVGASATTSGQVHSLAGARLIQFKDGIVDLLQTGLAAKLTQTAIPKNNEALAAQHSQAMTSAENSNHSQPAQGVNTLDSSGLPPPSNYSTSDTAPVDIGFSSFNRDNGSRFLTSNEANAVHTSSYVDNGPFVESESSSPSSRLVESSTPSQPTGVFAHPEDYVLLEPTPINGTPGPDLLIGTSQSDRIDGILNSELVENQFYEQLLGLDGDDLLFYRGFFGDFNANSSIKAQLAGGRGNDQISVNLDRTTQIQVDGGSGLDTLLLQVSESPFDPWSTQFMSWGWNFSTGSATLVGEYNSPLHASARLFESSASFEYIGSSNRSPLKLIRPTSEESQDLTGSGESELLIASTNTKTISAGGGDDLVISREGQTVKLGQGINTLYAKDSNVTLSYENTPFGVDANLAQRIGMVFDSSDSIYAIDRLMSDIQHLTGSALNDRLTGNHLDNTLRTGGGQDTLVGGAGSDRFILDIDLQAGPSRIQDFSFAEQDKVTLNLSGLNSPGNDLFTSYLIADAQGNTLFQGQVLQNAVEEGAILQLQLQAQSSSLYWASSSNDFTPLVDFNIDLNLFQSDQWAQILSVEYL